MLRPKRTHFAVTKARQVRTLSALSKVPTMEPRGWSRDDEREQTNGGNGAVVHRRTRAFGCERITSRRLGNDAKPA